MNEISPFFALEAEELLLAGQVENALVLCKQGIEIYPEYASAYGILAKASSEIGDMDFAIATISSALERFPLNKSLINIHKEITETEKIIDFRHQTLDSSEQILDNIHQTSDNSEQILDIGHQTLDSDESHDWPIQSNEDSIPSFSEPDSESVENMEYEYLELSDYEELTSEVELVDDDIEDISETNESDLMQGNVRIEDDFINVEKLYDELQQHFVGISIPEASEPEQISDIRQQILDSDESEKISDFRHKLLDNDEPAKILDNRFQILDIDDTEQILDIGDKEFENVQAEFEYESIKIDNMLTDDIITVSGLPSEIPISDNKIKDMSFLRNFVSNNMEAYGSESLNSKNPGLIPGLEFSILKGSSRIHQQENYLQIPPEPPPFPNYQQPIEQIEFPENGVFKELSSKMELDEQNGIKKDKDYIEQIASRLENYRRPKPVDDKPLIALSTEPAPMPVSETIASIYEMQGAFAQAMEAYAILSEQNPEKKEFYNNKINDLKKRI